MSYQIEIITKWDDEEGNIHKMTTDKITREDAEDALDEAITKAKSIVEYIKREEAKQLDLIEVE